MRHTFPTNILPQCRGTHFYDSSSGGVFPVSILEKISLSVPLTLAAEHTVLGVITGGLAWASSQCQCLIPQSQRYANINIELHERILSSQLHKSIFQNPVHPISYPNTRQSIQTHV